VKYADIYALLVSLLAQIQEILGDKLVGFYLYGSLVWGDFDYEISDIDLLAIIAADIDDLEFTSLKKMHDEFAVQHKQWHNRIEVQYFSASGLKKFKTKPSKMAVISPGEPFHLIEAGSEWLMNWYFVHEYGVTLFGPPPQNFIGPISKEEFIDAVKEHAKSWRKHIVQTMHKRPYQSYAILTMCRALYTVKNGNQVSKKQAALWAQEQLPEWSALIQRALLWRRGDWRTERADHESTYAEALKFVHYVIDQIA